MEDFYWLNEHSRSFLERGYLKEGQLAEDRLKEIAKNAEKILGIKGFSEKFLGYLAKGFYSLSTPVWTNYGNKRGLPVSCFGSYISDNMTEILGKVAEVGIMSKMGGGTSAYFGNLRPRGSKISVGGESSGPVHFMELFDTVADVISQGSARRGSFASYLPIEHPDIEEFLLVRSEGHPIQNMSIGITVTDEWMQQMIDGDKQKRNLWGKVIRKRCETGYPYVFFTDTVNNNAPEIYKQKGNKINASNLCVAGNQRVVSSLGLLTARELYEIGESLVLFDGNKKVNASKMELIEKNADVYKITLENGLSHTITSYHKVVKRQDLARPSVKTTEVVECKDLRIGDYILFQGKKGLFGDGSVNDEAFLLGLWQADGTSHNEDIMIDIWENDFDLVQETQEKFDKVYDKYKCSELHLKNRSYPKSKFRDCEVSFSKVKKKRLTSRALKKALNFEKGYIPEWIWTANEESQWSYIRGLYYADGTVNITNGKGNPFYLSITNTNLSFIEELQILLLNLGIKTSIYTAFEEGYRSLPDGNGEYKDYFCQKSYRLVTGNKTDGLLFEEKTGFLSRKGIEIEKETYRDNSKKFSKIKSIEYIGKEDVFCCTVDSPEHLWICNGFVTHNCSEITLSNSDSESFVCVLSSLNLLHWDEIVKTDAVETLIYFLDSVNEEFVQKTSEMRFMDAAHNFSKNQRALGMGVLGWHSLLQSKMIAFESLEAKMLNSEIWAIIRQRADDATHELAKLFGEPELLKGTGRRNVTTLAIAPTTSSSFILGQVSPSIEPENSNYYVKKLAKGSFTYKNPYLKKLLKEKNLDTDEIWKSILVRGGSVQHLPQLTQEEKDVFKTFGEISQKEIVIQAAQRQRFIDQSQSLNFMIPSGTHPKQINELMIEAWKMGVKTLYYQRSSNPSQELSRNIMTCTSCES